MTAYEVTWSINVEAENAVDAAEKCLAMQRDPHGLATVFRVDGGGRSGLIDVEIPGSPHVIRDEPLT